jgi:diacylglycerol kinase family enzyme
VGAARHPSGRALLVVNPAATTTRPELRDLIIAALEGTVELDVRSTRGRGHATDLAADAVAHGAGTVVVLGGDGTANEVLQALAHTPVALGLVPGGGANVLARALGLPADPVGATSRLLRALRTGARRRIGLGRADERLFAFSAGMGFDAAVVARVEHDPARKQLLRQLAFVGSALGELRTRRHSDAPPLRALLPDGHERAADIALVANTSPYTFLGSRPLTAHPGAAFELGLDLLTIEDATLPRLATVLAGALSGGRHVRLAGVHHDHDLAELVISSADGSDLPVHVDGDPLGPRSRLVLQALPDALDVLV